MEQKDLRNVSILSFINAFPTSPNASLDEDFYILDAKLHDPKRILSHPYRLDAYMVIYCARGNIKLNVNLREYELKKGMLFLNFPGNIIRVNEINDDEEDDFFYTCVIMSREFVANLLVDINRLFTQNVSFRDTPTIELSDSQRAHLHEHLALMMSAAQSGSQLKVEAVRSVLSATFYFLADIWADKASENRSSASRAASRSRMVFDQFIQLVTEYHTSNRNVGFYAEKLDLTPKYLSRIIKDVSGRSAPEWIDDYVILEAKNLLKYSGMPIKDVVRKLNFPSQSVFYKFFKSHTGMTPTDYKNS